MLRYGWWVVGGFPDGNVAYWERGIVVRETLWDGRGWEVSKGFSSR